MTDLSPLNTQEAHSSLQPGDTLADRYQLTHKLGEGGYSIVFAADDLVKYQQVAIKILKPGVVTKDPSALARMRQESHVMSKINHPHIARIYDFHSDEEATFLVMEKLLGRSIGKELKREGPASTQRVYPLVQQILSALEAAHTARVLHRDIKPENILLCPAPDANGSEIAIIVDFGLAKGLDTSGVHHDEDDITLVQTRTQGFVGTPRYTPPEQALGDPLGPETDLFALGLVIAEWLTGTVRLKGSRHAELMANLVSSDPIELGDCPIAWRPWLKKMLEKRPESRYQSAREASDALEHILQNPEHESNRELVFNPQTGEFVPETSSPKHQAYQAPSFLLSEEPLELDLPVAPPRRVNTPPPTRAPQPIPEPEPIEEGDSPLSIILLTAIAVVAMVCVILFAAIFFGNT